MTRTHLVYAGVGVLVLWLLTRNASAGEVTVGPSNAGGPGTLPRADVYEADPSEVQQVEPERRFGRASTPGFGTGSATRTGDYGAGPILPGEPYLAYDQETYR